MDGWYVKQLLLNNDSIRKNIFSEDTSKQRLDIDFDDDTYNDLLTVESNFNKLYNNGMFTDKEYLVAFLLINNNRVSVVAEKLKIHRDAVMPLFSKVCAKIAFNLGGYFTNDGFLHRLIKKYNLTSQQVEKLKEIMNK